MAAAYLLGSIPVGYLVSRRLGGLDIRRYGSGNVGATNVTRVLGSRLGALVLAGDVAKGALATWIGLRLVGLEGAVAGGLLAVVGHAWPVFLRFSGGKSVATGLGALAVLSAPVAAAAVITWAVVVLATRYVSLASVVSASTAPVWLWLAFHDWPVVGGGILMTLTVVFRHHSNVRRLLAGSEHRAY
ncbi:MAG: glycerol-3-phosphate 1-O-acyltransferase PlsY [Bacillota bacterium]